MYNIMIILLISVVTSVFATLLTLHILMNRDKKRNNKKLDNKKDIITPLQINKYQNKFPIMPNVELFQNKTTIITDPKGTEFERMKKTFEENGYKVEVFDLTKKYKGEVFDPSNIERENNNNILKGVDVTYNSNTKKEINS